MKGVLLTLEKNGVEVKTQHLGNGMVEWVDGAVEYSRIVGRGWKLKEDTLVRRALEKAENMWDRFCSGKRLVNEEFIDLVKILRGDV